MVSAGGPQVKSPQRGVACDSVCEREWVKPDVFKAKVDEGRIEFQCFPDGYISFRFITANDQRGEGGIDFQHFFNGINAPSHLICNEGQRSYSGIDFQTFPDRILQFTEDESKRGESGIGSQRLPERKSWNATQIAVFEDKIAERGVEMEPFTDRDPTNG